MSWTDGMLAGCPDVSLAPCPLPDMDAVAREMYERQDVRPLVVTLHKNQVPLWTGETL